MATIGKLAVQITADTTGLNQGLNSAEKTVSAFSDRMDGLASSLKTIAPLAVAAGAAFAFNMARALAESADRLDELSQRIGVSVEDLTRLQWAAKMSGASNETLTASLQKLSLNMANSKDPANEAATAFKALGIDVSNTDGTMRSQLEIMNEVADAFAGFKDGANKTAIAVQLFGRSGAELIPMLNGGSKSIKALAAESDKLGNTLSTKTAKAAAEFNDHLDRMTARASSVAKSIATPLLTNLNAFFDALERGVARASLASLASEVTRLNNDLKALQARGSNPFINSEVLTKNINETKAKLEEAKKAYNEAYDSFKNTTKAPELDIPKPTREAPSIAKPAEIKDPLGEFADKKLEEQAQRMAREEQMRIDFLTRNAEAMKLAALSELDQEQFKYEERLRLLEEYLIREPEMIAQYQGVKEQMAAEHEKRMLDIRKKGLTDQEKWNALSYKDQAKTVSSELMSMTGAAATENRKMFEINKAASLANAVIKGYESAVNAYSFGTKIGGPPVGAAMAALSVAATGAQISAIRSQTFGGGGGGTAYAPSGSTAATGQTAMQGVQGQTGGGVGQVITIQGIGAGDVFSGDSVRGLIDQLIEAQRNGSKVVLS